MGLLSLLLNNPFAFILIAVPLLYAIIFHELAHGYVAYKMGDPTAKQRGRLSLNPLRHLDPLGTLMLFLVGFGWAKPVPINLNNTKNKRLSDVLISFAGPASNIILTIVSLLILKICLSLYTVLPPIVSMFLLQMAIINLFLPIINLLPIPPLDGSHLIANVLPEKIKIQYQKLGYVGFFLLYFVLQLPLINTLFETVWNFLIELLDLPFP